MATITIDFEELEEDRRRRQLRRRLPVLIAAALGAMALLATDDERPPLPTPKPVIIEKPVRVPVPTEVAGPQKPVFVERVVIKEVPVVTKPTTTTATTTTATSTTTATPPPPPPPPTPQLQPVQVVPNSIVFMSSHWERAVITNPNPVAVEVTSIDAAGVNGAPVMGYRVDARKCVGTLPAGASCTITVFARDVVLRTRETIQIRVKTAP